MEDIVVSDVKHETDHVQISISYRPDQHGNCSRFFQSVDAAGIVVDMIVQNLSNNGRAELSFSVPRDDLTRALKRTQDVVREVDTKRACPATATLPCSSYSASACAPTPASPAKCSAPSPNAASTSA